MPFKAAISKPSQIVGRELFRAAFKCEGCQGRREVNQKEEGGKVNVEAERGSYV